MAVKDVQSKTMNVVEAAESRILNVFKSKLEIVLSTSGGKDSICLSHLVLRMINDGKIDPSRLIVQFIDEEAMYEDVIEIVKDWRRRFMLAGVRFEWYCIPALHFNCLNTLEDSDKHMIWDPSAKAKWVRPMPSFAITACSQLKMGKDSYQAFLSRLNRGRIQMMGVRASESLQRRSNIGMLNANLNSKSHLSPSNGLFPIYDWKDHDVWLYIKNNNIAFPQTYMDLYSIGTATNQLRISQFFAMDSCRALVGLSEIRPGLMDAVVRREPNAYMVMMYWDSEMFRRSSKNRRELERPRDYKEEVLTLLKNIPANFDSASMRLNAGKLKRLIFKSGFAINDKHWKQIYGSLIAGDAKNRIYRALYVSMFADYAQKIKQEEKKDAGRAKTNKKRGSGGAKQVDSERLQPEQGVGAEP